MLLYLTDYLSQLYSGFNLFGYLTFRAILGALTALSISLLVGPLMIRHLSIRQIGQQVRDFGPITHLPKAGTPTMGGALILIAISLSTLLWSRLDNYYVWVVLGVTLAFGTIGFIDDYRKLILKDSQGLSVRTKLFWQSMAALTAALVLYYNAQDPAIEHALLIPFFKDWLIPLGGFYLVFTYFVIVGTSNAVNLTDGLDGLAIMPCVLVSGALGIFAYASGNIVIAGYLGIPYIAGSGEMMVFCASLAGAGLGFLWFNTYPAQVFMGDIGALALGAAIGVVAVIVRQELILLVMGGVFVIETVSVILQVASFKLTGKRIFRMAPLHHHYELKGWAEPKVIVRFWIITVILVLVGLSSLNHRKPDPAIEHALLIPFFKDWLIPLGGFYLVFTYFVIVGTSNAVNLTDGLDGLAIMPCVLVSGALGIFAYASGNIVIAGYLGIPYIAGSGEMMVFCASLAGAGLGFLWFNTYPAQVFMGDIGALALGAAIGVVAVIVRQELILLVMGGVFVIETVSVILQVASFKLTGKRIFRMAPLHHHYELKGWAEPKVIVRFWIITVILVLVGLSSLKIR